AQFAIRTADHQAERHKRDSDDHLPAEKGHPHPLALTALLPLGHLQPRPLRVELFDAHSAVATAPSDEGNGRRAAGTGGRERLSAPQAFPASLGAGIAVPAREADDALQTK